VQAVAADLKQVHIVMVLVCGEEKSKEEDKGENRGGP
jgi:hypothetical protein